VERPINFSHYLTRALIVSTNDDSIGMLKVLNGGSFPQELWIGHDSNICFRAGFMNYARDLVASPDRNC
jgi:hypothetical protein